MSEFIPYTTPAYTEQEQSERAENFYQLLDKRRTVRDFSDRPVPRQLMEQLILTASTAPSGAHKQPWTFCLIDKNPELRSRIRAAAEEEERINYGGRMSEQWLSDLAPFDTDANKPFLEIAPWLVIVFKRAYEDEKRTNYYVNESVGLACGMLLAAIHNAGLVALTHTPSPMKFLTEILERPTNERPFLLIPVGYPAPDAKVPDLQRKQLEEVCAYYG